MNFKSTYLAFAVLLLLDGQGLALNVAAADSPAATMTRETQQAITPAEALAMLKRGNQRFMDGKMVNRDYAAQLKESRVCAGCC